jgi:carbon-monoxide dehydrogenase small subunit
MGAISVGFTLNGKDTTITTQADRSLLEVLREDLGLTGAKDACGGEGECGSCTVLLDGKAINSCLVLIGQIEGGELVTIEGLAQKQQYHPLQKAFVDAGAVQCGYCTPGAIIASKALLDDNSQPSEEEIREGLSGNLCRCTGYIKMIDAIHMVMKEGENG